MDATRTMVSHQGRPIAALRADPPAPAPGVLLIHDAWGLDDETAALVTALAAAGCTVLAPDLLAGRRAADADEARALAAGLDAEDAALLCATAVDALVDDLAPRAEPTGAVGVVGVGMGAPLAAFVATIRPAVAVAVLAGPVPDLPLEAWSAAMADLVVVVGEDGAGADAGGRDADATDAPDPAALDRARAGGRRIEVVAARPATLAEAIVEALRPRLRP